MITQTFLEVSKNSAHYLELQVEIYNFNLVLRPVRSPTREPNLWVMNYWIGLLIVVTYSDVSKHPITVLDLLTVYTNLYDFREENIRVEREPVLIHQQPQKQSHCRK